MPALPFTRAQPRVPKMANRLLSLSILRSIGIFLYIFSTIGYAYLAANVTTGTDATAFVGLTNFTMYCYPFVTVVYGAGRGYSVGGHLLRVALTLPPGPQRRDALVHASLSSLPAMLVMIPFAIILDFVYQLSVNLISHLTMYGSLHDYMNFHVPYTTSWSIRPCGGFYLGLILTNIVISCTLAASVSPLVHLGERLLGKVPVQQVTEAPPAQTQLLEPQSAQTLELYAANQPPPVELIVDDPSAPTPTTPTTTAATGAGTGGAGMTLEFGLQTEYAQTTVAGLSDSDSDFDPYTGQWAPPCTVPAVATTDISYGHTRRRTRPRPRPRPRHNSLVDMAEDRSSAVTITFASQPSQLSPSELSSGYSDQETDIVMSDNDRSAIITEIGPARPAGVAMSGAAFEPGRHDLPLGGTGAVAEHAFSALSRPRRHERPAASSEDAVPVQQRNASPAPPSNDVVQPTATQLVDARYTMKRGDAIVEVLKSQPFIMFALILSAVFLASLTLTLIWPFAERILVSSVEMWYRNVAITSPNYHLSRVRELSLLPDLGVHPNNAFMEQHPTDFIQLYITSFFLNQVLDPLYGLVSLALPLTLGFGVGAVLAMFSARTTLAELADAGVLAKALAEPQSQLHAPAVLSLWAENTPAVGATATTGVLSVVLVALALPTLMMGGILYSQQLPVPEPAPYYYTDWYYDVKTLAQFTAATWATPQSVTLSSVASLAICVAVIALFELSPFGRKMVRLDRPEAAVGTGKPERVPFWSLRALGVYAATLAAIAPAFYAIWMLAGEDLLICTLPRPGFGDPAGACTGYAAVIYNLAYPFILWIMIMFLAALRYVPSVEWIWDLMRLLNVIFGSSSGDLNRAFVANYDRQHHLATSSQRSRKYLIRKALHPSVTGRLYPIRAPLIVPPANPLMKGI